MASHDHAHESRPESKGKMLIVLGVTCVFMIVEVVAAYFTHSLALLADAGHMLTDVGALLLGLVAIWFTSKPANAEKTYGYYRSEILAGFINAIALVGISIYILTEAYQRLQSPPEVSSVPVFCVALVGALVNFLSLKLLHSHQDSINARAAYLEILSDFFVSIGVMVSSAVVYFTHWYAADPIISALIGVIILPRTWLLLTECTNILMEGTPAHVNVPLLRESILKVPGVLELHDIHVWTITSGLDAMSGHVLIDSQVASDSILDAVTKACNEFGLHHTTIQIEQAVCNEAGVCIKRS
jgi:cobalt-zinc-cadmium efflux system protein